MNEQLERYARQELKAGLFQCNEAQQHLFKRMYSHGNLELDIDSVVDAMPVDKLDRAMDQVERTVTKNLLKAVVRDE